MVSSTSADVAVVVVDRMSSFLRLCTRERAEETGRPARISNSTRTVCDANRSESSEMIEGSSSYEFVIMDFFDPLDPTYG